MLAKEIIEARLSQHVLKFSSLSGGDINQVFYVETSDHQYVVKCNKRDNFPKMFVKEAEGLRKLAQNKVNTPQVEEVFEQGEYQLLILGHIESEPVTRLFWKNFGMALANLHKNSENYFGLTYPNYIGSLEQINEKKPSWETFFIENRIQPLVKKAFDRNFLDRKHLRWFDGFLKAYPELIPKEKPSLLHGDLWSGNLLCGRGQVPFFIDPAIYYGHREVDIAMTHMFGGFDRSYLYDYNEIFPLEEGWERRLDIHNLYPNLVHLVLFGPSYLSGIEGVIKVFGR